MDPHDGVDARGSRLARVSLRAAGARGVVPLARALWRRLRGAAGARARRVSGGGRPPGVVLGARARGGPGGSGDGRRAGGRRDATRTRAPRQVVSGWGSRVVCPPTTAPADGTLFPSLGNVLCAPPEPELVAEERKRRKEEREKVRAGRSLTPVLSCRERMSPLLATATRTFAPTHLSNHPPSLLPPAA